MDNVEGFQTGLEQVSGILLEECLERHPHHLYPLCSEDKDRASAYRISSWHRSPRIRQTSLWIETRDRGGMYPAFYSCYSMMHHFIFFHLQLNLSSRMVTNVTHPCLTAPTWGRPGYWQKCQSPASRAFLEGILVSFPDLLLKGPQHRKTLFSIPQG